MGCCPPLAAVMEHRWPAASATVYSIREDSEEVKPSRARQHNLQVFWVEFLVILDLPKAQCPGLHGSVDNAGTAMHRNS
jgi:hypothetical protein